MLKQALILALVCAFASAGPITVGQCNGGGVVPDWVEVEGCDGTCSVPNGSTMVVTAGLTAGYDSSTLLVGIRAWVSIIEIPYDVPEELQDGCLAIVGGCPLTAGSEYDISTAFELNAPLSGVTPDVELSLTDQDGNVALCARFKITIT